MLAQLFAWDYRISRCGPRHIQVYPDRPLPTAAPSRLQQIKRTSNNGQHDLDLRLHPPDGDPDSCTPPGAEERDRLRCRTPRGAAPALGRGDTSAVVDSTAYVTRLSVHLSQPATAWTHSHPTLP